MGFNQNFLNAAQPFLALQRVKERLYNFALTHWLIETRDMLHVLFLRTQMYN